jgi:predicted permease
MNLEAVWDDARKAARGLWRARAFTVTAVATLAIGIGGATTMFALVQGILLRPLPVREQERLIVGWKAFPSGQFNHYPFKATEIEVIGRESRLFEQVGGVSYNGAGPGLAIEDGITSSINTTSVTGTFFATLGMRPVLGRALQPADDVAGVEKVLVITHGLWQRRYGGSRDVIGRRLMLSYQPFTIVGVMPPGLDYPRGVEGWMTVEAMASLVNPAFQQAVRDENDLVARLRPGVTLEQARAELGGLVARLEADSRFQVPRGLFPVLTPCADVVVGDVRPAVFALFAAVGLVLLVACANVANLLLLRAESRRTELAVRSALGAGRSRFARQLLAESVWVALLAAVLGLLAARAALPAVLALVPGGLPRAEAIGIDAGVATFTVAAALFAAALAAVVPALFAGRADVASLLRTGRQAGAGSASHGRRVLVVMQMALAVTVVAAAGLLTRSLLLLRHVETGLAADRLVFVTLSRSAAEDLPPDRRLQFLSDAVARLEAAPGIERATPVNTAPYGTGWDAPSFTAEGQTFEDSAGNPSLNFEAVYPNHFSTLGIAMDRGRAFAESDRPGGPQVAILSEDVAARVWPGRDPIGKRLRLPGFDDPWWTVVGVARSVRYRELAVARPTVYLPAAQSLVTAETMAVRTTLPLAAVAALARERLRPLDPPMGVSGVVPFRDLRARPLVRPRFNAFLIGLFGVVALVLAVVGLYAVMAAYVRQRQAEIGIRMALGATTANVGRLVLGEGLRLAGAGALIGLAAALAAARLVRGLLFGVHPLDPASITGAAALLVAASLLACYLPARRASRVDPLDALRAI